MVKLLLCLFLLGAPQATRLTKPSALLALEESRRSGVMSGIVQWDVWPEGLEALSLSYVSRYARNGDRIFENRGDKDGWTEFDPATKRGRHKYPKLYMSNGDGYWQYDETTLSCGFAKRSGAAPRWLEQMRDIRYIGISPTSGSLHADVGFDIIYGEQRPHELVGWQQEKNKDGDYIVTAEYKSGMKVIWQIDPQRGWNAEGVAVEADGRTVREVVCSLRKFGNTWLPETATYYRNGEVTEIIRIKTARLNEPGDPAGFTGNDLGLEPGINLVAQNFPVKLGKPPIWNGDAIAEWDDWVRDVKAGVRQWGPKYQRANRREPFTSPYDTESMRRAREISALKRSRQAKLGVYRGLWQRYVEDFVKQFRLNEEQSQKAHQVLKSCQARAKDIQARKQAEFSRVMTELEAARKSSDRGKVKDLQNKLKEMREPIDRIFREQLKPRLEKLPTRAQRKAAEKNAPDGATRKQP